MTPSTTPKKKYTFDEYLILERAEGTRHSFWDGEVTAMAGATKRHNMIVQNCTFSLRQAARKNGCQVFSENVRQKLPNGERYVYPDVIYTCDPGDLSNDLSVYNEHPCLLMEVLSESTGNDDDHKKRLHYFKLTSLQYYMLVSQEAYKVEVYERAADFWKYRLYAGIETTIPFPLINLTLAMAAIFEAVPLEGAEE